MKSFSIIICGIMVLAICACASGHKSSSSSQASHSAADTAYGLPDSLRDGSSYERSIVIRETSETAGVNAEYRWIRENQPGFKTTMQSLRFYQGRSYDVLHIKNGDGAEKDIFFDISRFYGKF